MDLAEDETRHRQRADADPVVAFLEACDGAFGHANPRREVLHGNPALQPRSPDVRAQRFKSAARAYGIHFNRHI